MTGSARLDLPGPLADTLIAEARTAHGFEVCGFIAVTTDGTTARYAIANRAPRPADRFDMDAAEQIAAFKQMREAGETLIAIYHSHPRGEAVPSAHDVQGHSYPDVAALIVAPEARAATLRAWDMSHTPPTELDIVWQQTRR